MAKITLTVNGAPREISASPKTSLLSVLREQLDLRGTKFGCGVGECGICTVHSDGAAIRSCVTLLEDIAGKRITTIEGLAGDRGHPVLRAWYKAQVPQCGYCQPGFVMAAAALIARDPKPSDAAIDEALSGILCRCGTYQRVRRAMALLRRRDRSACGGLLPLPITAPADHETKSVALNPWIRIGGDNTVVLVIDRSEMGQGVATALSMLAAEELGADLGRIRIAFAPAARAYQNPLLGAQVTGGSTSVAVAWRVLRPAAASARMQLIAAAARFWSVRVSDCVVHDGAVHHRRMRLTAPFSALAADAALIPAPNRPRLKRPRDFEIVGRPTPRIEVASHLDGSSVFGVDVVVPGMKIASVARAPILGGHLERYDRAAALAIPGVRDVVEIEAGIAVVADDFPSALRGRQALGAVFRKPDNTLIDSADISRRLRDAIGRKGQIAREAGDVERAFKSAASILEAVYETPYVAHATLEPPTCTARIGPDGCDVWAPTQAQTESRIAAAAATRLPQRAVRVHTTFLGGGFGRKLQTDFVAEAVETARKTGQPIQVVWTRADDLQHDFYRPANLTLLRAALGRNGRPTAWLQRIAGPELALEGVDIPYAIPNLREEHVTEDPGVPTGPWRSVGASQNAFAIECFIDELAAAAGADPVAYRRALLGKAPRHRRVLELAATKAGWRKPPSRGRHRGIAVYSSFNSYVAEVAEVSVSRGREITVHRVVVAVDCGRTVNPDAIEAQLEGAIAFGLTAALKSAITLKNGEVEQHDFRDFPLLTLREMPEVQVHMVQSTKDPTGIGEPGVPPIAPAVANAVFAAAGRRLRRLPLILSEGTRSHV